MRNTKRYVERRDGHFGAKPGRCSAGDIAGGRGFDRRGEPCSPGIGLVPVSRQIASGRAATTLRPPCALGYIPARRGERCADRFAAGELEREIGTPTARGT